jgi:hypothetical protein
MRQTCCAIDLKCLVYALYGPTTFNYFTSFNGVLHQGGGTKGGGKWPREGPPK